MELWIRSQDRKRLIKVNQADTDLFFKRIIVNGNLVIGFYETEERCIEILDEIQKKITPVLMIKQTNPIKYTDYNMTISDATLYVENVSELKEVGMTIYEMPKE